MTKEEQFGRRVANAVLLFLVFLMTYSLLFVVYSIIPGCCYFVLTFMIIVFVARKELMQVINKKNQKEKRNGIIRIILIFLVYSFFILLIGLIGEAFWGSQSAISFEGFEEAIKNGMTEKGYMILISGIAISSYSAVVSVYFISMINKKYDPRRSFYYFLEPKFHKDKNCYIHYRISDSFVMCNEDYRLDIKDGFFPVNIETIKDTFYENGEEQKQEEFNNKND